MGKRLALLALGMVVLLLASACSRLSFVKPDLSRGDFQRTAPELDISTDARNPTAAEARVAIAEGQRYLTLGKLDEAAVLAERALDLDDDSATAHTLAALVADRRGQARDAGDHYRRAVELAPAQGGMLNNYGTWLCQNGQAAASLEWFDRALADRNYPTPAVAMANAGACADQAGEGARAERYLEAAIGLQPENPVALGVLADRAFRDGDFLRARAFSQRRLAAAPATAASLWLASQIEEKLGDMEAAASYVQRMRAEFPDTRTPGTGENGRR